MLLAELTNQAGLPAAGSAPAVGWLFMTLAAILVAINAAFTLKKNILPTKTSTEISPQPISVQLVEHYVRKEECVGRHNESSSKIGQLQSQMEVLRLERKEETGQLRAKVDRVSEDVNGLKVATDMQNQKLASMDAKLDRIVEKRVSQM